MKVLLLLLCCSCLYSEKTVFLTSVIRDQAHLLPRFLQTIENYDYDKKLITIHFYTYNNNDQSQNLLNTWAKQQKDLYKNITIECVNFPNLPLLLNYQVKEYSYEENKALGELKNKGLLQAKGCDCYFYVDPTALLAPHTLKKLIAYDKPIIAPLLKCIPECDDHTSNFFAKVNEAGYYDHDENYIKILFHWNVGAFQVPLIRDALLIKEEVLDKLSYTDDAFDFDFITFSRNARKSGIEQHLSNEHEFGVKIHFFKPISREEETRRLRNILLMP
jgi:hypothetical protein